jgi:hypothetical protein
MLKTLNIFPLSRQRPVAEARLDWGILLNSAANEKESFAVHLVSQGLAVK